MTSGAVVVALGVGVVGLSLAGPWLLRRSAPALVRAPRTAVGFLVLGVVGWLTTLLTLGPALAWSSSGPALLGGAAGEVCQRCLAAANPFPGGGVDTAVPALLLLALPVGIGIALTVAVARSTRRRLQQSRQLAVTLREGARCRTIAGYEVTVVESDQVSAFALPDRHGGIFLSTGALKALDPGELEAVLAHEAAHVRQRHHALAAFMASVDALLGRVPLVRAAAEALPHYLEIAADNASRRHAGTPALVSALLKIGEHARSAARDEYAVALHMVGPARVRQLVRPSRGAAGAFSTAAISAQLLVLLAVSSVVYAAYGLAALHGC